MIGYFDAITQAIGTDHDRVLIIRGPVWNGIDKGPGTDRFFFVDTIKTGSRVRGLIGARQFVPGKECFSVIGIGDRQVKPLEGIRRRAQ